MHKKTIFVSIASFCDDFLEFTIKNACENKSNKHEIFFGIVDQSTKDSKDNLKKYSNNIRYLNINPIESRGVCWARNIAMSLYLNEDYYMQIDSHTFFEKNWDDFLIKEIESLKTEKPIISAYPYGFELKKTKELLSSEEIINSEVVINNKGIEKYTTYLRPIENTLTESNKTLRFQAKHLETENHIEGFHLAGGFIFASGRFVEEVPYDPYYYFHGEEQNMSIRSYTKGWNIIHPKFIPIYHLYKRPNIEYNSHHWSKDWESKRDFKWVDLNNNSRKRLLDLVSGKNMGAYGLGNRRTIEDFSQNSGIFYSKNEIQEDFKPKEITRKKND